ncbi:helix-turn-helix transcriptional regulator [Desulfonatronovibrio hydrogenovorans]|uniref:helix-turn-helix transcriptional regulator n=1 Tax=Desulfonatronovibrio hydrogenovorans TaxID=53245 RepID=UPI00068B5588|nr:PAS domain-containing protein [Desulfonatronovibrio hydrogenovorans]
MMDEKEHIFRLLEQVAQALSAMFPKNMEVVVHDVSRPNSSIRHISGNVTGRSKGGPVTDLVVRSLHVEGNKCRDSHNYRTTSSDGRALKSSTVFIRDREGEVFAVFCINLDLTDYLNASRALEMFTAVTSDFNGQGRVETFSSSISETIESLIDQAVAKTGREPSTMSMDERIRTVAELGNSGVFKIKGGIDLVALRLGVSKCTIYNYLKKIETDQMAGRI